MSVKKIDDAVRLLDEWAGRFSKEEKSVIRQQLEKQNNSFLLLSILETIKSVDTNRQLGLVGNLIGLFNTKKNFDIAQKIAERGKQLESLCTDIVEVHFYYMHMINVFYKMRNDIPDALDIAIHYCKRQIEIAPKVAVAMKSEFKQGLPSHTGYKQLSIIFEKQGKYDLAIQLCEEAFIAGWGEGVTTPKSTDDWEKRIQRLQKKKEKNVLKGKNKSDEKNTDSASSSDIMKIPCPHCGSVLLIPHKYIGVQGVCKKCNQKFIVPDKGS